MVTLQLEIFGTLPKALLGALLVCSGVRIAELGRHNSAALPGAKAWHMSTASLIWPSLFLRGRPEPSARGMLPSRFTFAPPGPRDSPEQSSDDWEASVPGAYRVMRVDDASYPYLSCLESSVFTGR